MSTERKMFRDELENIFIAYALIPTLIFSIIFYSFFIFNHVRTIKSNNKKNNQNVAEVLEHEFIKYENEINSLIKNPSILDTLAYINDKTSAYEYLYDFVNTRELGSLFYLFDNEGELLLTNSWEKESRLSGINEAKQKISKLKSFANGTHMLREENILLAKKETVYSIGRKIQNHRGRDIGYILFEFLQNDFNNIIHNAHVDSIVVTDKFKNVILSTNNTLINEIGKLALNDMGAGWQEFRATNYYVYRSNILNNGITIYTLTIMNPVNESYILGLAFMILIFVFLLLLTRITARKMAKNKSKSLDELLAAIKRVQKGDLNAFVDIKTNDEFEIIGAYYNKMLIKINKLIDENEEQAERNKIVEIKQLESQFNPHFLFNTLEIIKYTIRTAPENAVKILVSMSNLLRYSINNKEQKVELQNDIEHIKDYMLIQKFRFENSLNYELEMESGVEECIVPKLTIQPFIENSIKYGFLDREALNIRLRCFFQEVNIAFGVEKDLILEISNDGKHIDEQQMSEIKELLHGADNKTNHIGIYNIHRRVQLMYGKEYGVSIENQYENECDSGVVVTIKLPVIFKETGVIDD